MWRGHAIDQHIGSDSVPTTAKSIRIKSNAYLGRWVGEIKLFKLVHRLGKINELVSSSTVREEVLQGTLHVQHV